MKNFNHRGWGNVIVVDPSLAIEDNGEKIGYSALLANPPGSDPDFKNTSKKMKLSQWIQKEIWQHHLIFYTEENVITMKYGCILSDELVGYEDYYHGDEELIVEILRKKPH